MYQREALRRPCDSHALSVQALGSFISTNVQFVRLLRQPRSPAPANTQAVRFYGVEENKREVEMDMREMVDKIKRNEPLYGKSSLTPYMQGVASRNSRYSGIWLHVIPWFNFVNHDQALLTFYYKFPTVR